MQEFTFDTFKEYLLQQAKAKNACSEEYIKAYNSKSWSALLQVIKDNICWCYRNNILFVEIMRRLPQQVLIDNNIYVDQTQVVQRDGFAIYYNSTSEHYDNSTSKHYGNSTSKHYGNSTSEHHNNSTSNHYYNSTSEHYDNSTSKHYDNSTSKHYDRSTSEHYGSSTSGSVHVLKNVNVITDQAIVRERSTGKVYFKKNAFETVQID